MERGSDLHNPRVDDELVHDTAAVVPVATGPGTMDPAAVEVRRDLARHVHPSSFPADRDVLVAETEAGYAPASVVERLRGLPDRRYEDLEEVWEATGGAPEGPRS